MKIIKQCPFLQKKSKNFYLFFSYVFYSKFYADYESDIGNWFLIDKNGFILNIAGCAKFAKFYKWFLTMKHIELVKKDSGKYPGI